MNELTLKILELQQRVDALQRELARTYDRLDEQTQLRVKAEDKLTKVTWQQMEEERVS